jgi:hypothetical protein
MVIATLVLLALLLVLTHNVAMTHRVLASRSTTAPDGTVSSIQVYFYRTVIGTAGFYLFHLDPGIRIISVTGVYEQDQSETQSAINDIVQSSNWLPLRRDDHLVRVIEALQLLIPLAIAAAVFVSLIRTRSQLNSAKLCLNCAYSLEGIDQSSCPECGQLRS